MTKIAPGTLTGALIGTTVCWLLLAASVSAAQPAGETATAEVSTLPALTCVPEQTGGFHDYPEGEEEYEPALFHPRSFTLKTNALFMMTLQAEPGAPDLYVTLNMAAEEAGFEQTELECRRVRGIGAVPGFSCVNVPPSELLLINAQTLRFTRAALGGWTFAGAAGDLSGDSIYIEYGTCSETQAPES